ncbi:MAG: hypothetical protein ACJAY2_001989 [Pseudomonadales bacterium]|jgi:hypothetical protein
MMKLLAMKLPPAQIKATESNYPVANNAHFATLLTRPHERVLLGIRKIIIVLNAKELPHPSRAFHWDRLTISVKSTGLVTTLKSGCIQSGP